MVKNQILEILKVLQHVKQRPEMYASEDVLPIVNFINGFNVACHALGACADYRQLYSETLTERGWSVSGLHPSQEMAEKGMDTQKIISEFLEIELEVWRKMHEHQSD